MKESLEKVGLSVYVERASHEFMNGDTTIKVEAEKEGFWTTKKTGKKVMFLFR